MSSHQPAHSGRSASGIARGGRGDPGAAPPWWADRERPVRTAAVLVAAPVALTVLIGLLAVFLFPGTGEQVVMQRRLAAVVVVAILALAILARAHAWRRTGSAGPLT